MAKLKFGEVLEEVITREEFPLEKAKQVLAKETVAVIGYGVQGPAQALNLRDNGINVIVGQRKESSTWEKAVKDGWIEGKTLFSIEEASKKGTIIVNLLSDAAQINQWETIKKELTPGKLLLFSHGFGVVYKDVTKIIPPKDIDVALVAPKGSGTSVRRLFTEKKGINSSYAIFQDSTGKTKEKTFAYGIAVGSGYLFETTFTNEVTSDLYGERGVLLGGLAGMIHAQYEVLRENGHSPSEAFNETVEELTQSLVPLISQLGMDGMFANCSTTAQRGALDWMEPFKEANKPVFVKLYESVKTGNEAKRTIDLNSKSDYREKLNKELEDLRNREIWQAGITVRKLRA